MAHLESYRERRAQGSLSRARRSARLPPAAVTAVVLALLVVAWEAGVRLGWVRALFLPAPTTIAQAVAKLLAEGDLLMHVGTTLSRMALGMAIGGAPAVALGLVMGTSSALRAALDPVIAAAHVVPKIALMPLILIVFGVGENAFVVVSVLGAFFPMLINTMSGARQIPPIHFDVARNYGASRARVFWRVLVPGSFPSIWTGIRLATVTTLLLTISAEMVMVRRGLGSVIWSSWQTFRIEELYVALVAIIIIGAGANSVLQRLSHRLAPWQHERAR